MNAGQMVHDVRAAVGAHFPVEFYGRMGGVIPMPEEIERESRAALQPFLNPELEGHHGNLRD
jgi:2-oxoglutarate ferredoxin oxidoreductase subunit alpha